MVDGGRLPAVPHAEGDPPPPPPKEGYSGEGVPPQLGTLPTFAGLDADLSSPMTPTSPDSPSTAEHRPKKSNPLIDLIDTEKTYVDLLTAIIRKVAAAWSRSNLPPPELDTMFRSIESIYKANRSLLSRLKDIGPNPSSPKALGDLLMQWIDDLDVPYQNYAQKYSCGFDSWDPVQNNSKLPNILAALSSASPPPSSSPSDVWELDALFIQPKGRLKYYRKLYSRLLKSTTPGRSDHRLLVRALDRLDGILDTLDSRAEARVGSAVSNPVSPASSNHHLADEVVIDLRTQSVISNANGRPHVRSSDLDLGNGSESSSARGSSQSGQRSSRETANTSISRGSSQTLSMPVTDLERRLATERTLDIFTMKPKVVRLQMAPPSLIYKRELRCSVDVVIRVTPRATGQEWVHQRGHIYLLTDLFLVCERMTPDERADGGPDGPDMWLCYPPLAGKVLRVSEVPGQNNVLEVAIMRKENLYIHTESTQVRDFVHSEFRKCIEFASSVPPPSKQPPPPVPPLSEAVMNSDGSPPSNRAPSIRSSDSHGASIGPPANATNDRRFSPQQNFHHQQTSPSNSMYNRPLPSAGVSQPNPIGPGEIVPPARNASFAPGQRLSPGGLPTNPHPNHQVQAPRPQFGPGPTPDFAPPSFQGPPRSPSEPGIYPSIRKSPSTRSLGSHFEKPLSAPPHQPPLPSLPPGPGGYNNGPLPPPPPIGGYNSNGPIQAGYHPNGAPARPLLPSMQNPGSRGVSMADAFDEPSPPNSPVAETKQFTGPVTSTISAQMKCKVFLKQNHAQWKSLGAAKLKLYRQDPTNVKQLVVEADSRSKSVLISTIVLTDGVERVGKTGVAIELSDRGSRTGIVYMIQLRNETSAGGLFDSLLAGSDRSGI